MMGHHHGGSPAFVAEADQNIAAAGEQLQKYVDRFREHAAEHQGDILCPICETTGNAWVEYPVDVVRMFGVAVMRLARQEPNA